MSDSKSPRDPEAGAVLVISSHVTRGSVGNRSTVFVLETLGFPVWAIHTIMLPWHPGYGRATRIVPSREEFAEFLADIAQAPWLHNIAAVVSGYLGDASQAAAIATLVGKIKAANPAALYICDPILGDAEGLYVPSSIAEAQRDILLPLANIATPNRYELAWLTGRTLNSLRDLIDAGMDLTPEMVVITSVSGTQPDMVGNLLITPNRVWLAEHPMINKRFSGTGDLMTALFLSRLLTGENEEQALQKTASAVYQVLKNTSARGSEELMLELEVPNFTIPQVVATISDLTGLIDKAQ